MDEARIEQSLTDDYLSRYPSLSKRAAYVRRTMNKARNWVALEGWGFVSPFASQPLASEDALALLGRLLRLTA